MALLVDGGLSGIDDLRAQDSGVLDVANGEGIDLHAKLRLTELELQVEVERFLQQEGKGCLEQVAASGGLKLWHALKALESVYRDAYFSQLNDRYGARWEHYAKLAERQRALYFDDGVKLVSRPLRRPEAVRAEIVEGTMPAATYWVRATYLDAYGQESGASEVSGVSSPVPHGLTVSAPYAPEGVTHWNVYAGAQEDALGLQNDAPLAVGTEWRLPEGGLKAGRPVGDGQQADGVVKRSGLTRRG